MVREGWVSQRGVPIFRAHGSEHYPPVCRNTWPAKMLPPAAGAARRVVLVDFDDVLFHTPRRPSWWPFRSFDGMMQSLLPPCVPTTVSNDWFNAEVAREIEMLQAESPTWSVLNTFRKDAFRMRIQNLLAQGQARGETPTFHSMRFLPMCKCCSPLGFTHSGDAGYGRLTQLLVEAPQRPEDKHLLVILGDVLQDCPQAHEVLQMCSCNFDQSRPQGSGATVLET